MDSLATDVLREIKMKEIRNRIFIILISIIFWFFTNLVWFLVWNYIPNHDEGYEIEEMTDDDDDNDTSQGNNEKSE